MNFVRGFFTLFLLFSLGGIALCDDLAGDSGANAPAAADIAAGTDAPAAAETPADQDAASVADTAPPVDLSAPIYSAPVEAEPSFKLSETESSIVFSQRLTWEKAQYAVRYVVILERKRDNLEMYNEVLRRNVDAENPYLDISVPAGTYRYRVQSYNILDQLDTETPWQEFTIIQALQPSVVSFDPVVFYLDRETPRNLTLAGENLLPKAEIYLQNQVIPGDAGILRPKEIYSTELGESTRLIFSEEDLVVGKYDIVVKNPGGLETKAGVFSVAIAKPYDINVAVGYSPMMTLFGQRDFFLDHFFVPLGFSARASYIPFKWDIGYIGVELTPSWTLLDSAKDQKKTTAHLVVVNVDALYQYWIRRREVAINGRVGFGFAGVFNYQFQYTDTGKDSKSMSTAAFSFNLGASVQWFFYKQFFVEGGLDYIHIAHPEIPMGFVKIGVFGGYQF